MTRVAVSWSAMVMCVAMLAGCARGPANKGAPSERSGPLSLTEKDAGRSVELRVGGRLELALPGNPTTGYNWDVVAINANVLKPDGKRQYERARDRIGSGGSLRFVFEAMAPGRTRLGLIYHRPWERNVAPAKTFEVTVWVR